MFHFKMVKMLTTVTMFQEALLYWMVRRLMSKAVGNLVTPRRWDTTFGISLVLM